MNQTTAFMNFSLIFTDNGEFVHEEQDFNSSLDGTRDEAYEWALETQREIGIVQNFGAFSQVIETVSL
jgi:hypothetical protein